MPLYLCADSGEKSTYSLSVFFLDQATAMILDGICWLASA